MIYKGYEITATMREYQGYVLDEQGSPQEEISNTLDIDGIDSYSVYDLQDDTCEIFLTTEGWDFERVKCWIDEHPVQFVSGLLV